MSVIIAGGGMAGGAPALADRGARTVGRDQQLPFQRVAVIKLYADCRFTAGNARHARRAVQMNARRLAQQAEKPLTGVMQLHDIPQCLCLVVARVQRHKPGVTAIADVNGGDGRSAGRERLPDANARQLAAGAVGKRDGAGVKPRMRGGFRRAGFHQMHRQRAMGKAGDRQRKRRASHRCRIRAAPSSVLPNTARWRCCRCRAVAVRSSGATLSTNRLKCLAGAMRGFAMNSRPPLAGGWGVSRTRARAAVIRSR